MSHSPRGSLWHRWDLHFHTPSSFDYGNKVVSDKQLVDGVIAAGIAAVAVTDHHVIDVARIRSMQELAGTSLTVLPGIELRDDHGREPVHYVCIFPEDCDLEHVWTSLQGTLGLTAAALKAKGGDQAVYVPIEQGATEARRLGGVVTIHAGGKSNSIEGISHKEQFQRRIKYDITRQFVDFMEVGQLKDVGVHLHTIFPATGLDRPLIICSDNHDISDYKFKVPLWLRCDPCFRGLLMVTREPRDRVFIGDRPDALKRVEQSSTRYIRSVRFTRRPTAPKDAKWFSGTVSFNPGLVAIVGNKGSGKSALADTLGLLGASRSHRSFSFLNGDRFRHPQSGMADHFEATIEWESGETRTLRLSDSSTPEEVERIKYLPQEYVETVCNELAGSDELGFEKELKSVIFSHVPESQRLGLQTLDELVRFQTGEKQKRIDSLFRQLQEVNRNRAALELSANPSVRRELTARLAQRQKELEVHALAKPDQVVRPEAGSPPDAAAAALAEQVAKAEVLAKGLEGEITATTSGIAAAGRRHAVSVRVLERLENFRKDFDAFRGSLEPDAKELGLEVANLVTFAVNAGDVLKAREVAHNAVTASKALLDNAEPPGLKQRLAQALNELRELRSRLDAPNRKYQEHLKAVAEWQAAHDALVGTPKDADSLAGLQAALADQELLPQRIEEATTRATSLALEIHAEKAAQAKVFRDLYGPVQDFVDSHPLAKGKLKLEFRAALSAEDFADRFLDFLALNRRGSFMGVEEGRVRAVSLVKATAWEDPASVKAFLSSVDRALHVDEREGQGSATVQMKDQLAKGKRLDEALTFLYGLDYLRPKYVLRWDGKDLSILSPGERGTLLLVFYLLIDKSNVPLAIDQPEGNLDNNTVARVLVDCIKEARKQRQVFIVTHNPNLAVVCDADQVVYATMDKTDGSAVTYSTGSLESPTANAHVIDVLEGTRWAFTLRGSKYEVGAPPES